MENQVSGRERCVLPGFKYPRDATIAGHCGHFEPALVAGKIDCVIIDNEPAKAFVAANPGLVVLDTAYAVEDYAICYAKGNEKLGEKIDKALQELIAAGEVQKIIDKYISAE